MKGDREGMTIFKRNRAKNVRTKEWTAGAGRRPKLLAVMVLCIAAVMLISGCGKPPTLGTTVKDYDGFKYLSDATLKPGSGDEEIQVFIPKGSSEYSSTNYVSSTAKGVSITLKIVNSSLVDNAGGAKEYIQKYGTISSPNLSAAVDEMNSVKKTKDENSAYATGFQVLKKYDNSYYSVCITEFLSKIEVEKKEYYVSGVVKVNSDSTGDDTGGLLEEMKSYYGMKMYWDKEKAKEEADKYTKNPPEYTRQYVGGFVVQIPTGWAKDNAYSKSSGSANVAVFGPNGKATEADNLMAAYSMISGGTGDYSSSDFERQLKAYLNRAYNGVTVKTAAVDSPIDGGKAYKVKLTKGNVSLNGYLVFGKYSMIMVYNAGTGQMSSKTKERVENMFNTLQDYSAAKNSKSGSTTKTGGIISGNDATSERWTL